MEPGRIGDDFDFPDDFEFPYTAQGYWFRISTIGSTQAMTTPAP